MNVKSQSGAEAAIILIDKAIGKVSKSRSDMGGLQNALQSTLNNVNQYNEHLTAAESNIRDANIAQEMMAMTKSTIIRQVASAMQVRATQNPQSILQLLQTN